MKKFDDWNLQKKELDQGLIKLYKAREIWWCSLGVNLGYEQDGTGKEFHRPVVIIKGLSKQVCLIVPLTTSEKINPYHVSLGIVAGKNSFAIISQIRLIDTRRLVDKVGVLNEEVFIELKNRIREIF